MMPRILLSVPHMSGRELVYVQEAFASNWLSTVGPNLDRLEQAFQNRFGLPAVAVSSGTAAIHLGLRALGVAPGDTVFCSDLTFVASVNPIRYLGAGPVLIDSEPATWNMDPALLARALADSAAARRLPKAVIVVHLFGQCADMDPILEACARYHVPVLEDAAEALGATYRGRPAGTLGDLAAFSFNGNKIITATGGGLLLSRRPGLAAKARFWATQARDPGLAYEHSEMGYNYRMSNVLAGIARGQLEVLDQRVAARRAIAARYREEFAGLPGISPMPEDPGGKSTHWLSCFLIDEPQFGCSRDALIHSLAVAGIESRPVWKPMHLQPLYAAAPRYGGAVAEDLFRRGICLPSSSSLTLEDQAFVIQQVRQTREIAIGAQLSALSRHLSEPHTPHPQPPSHA
jgi:pyridoxal phosphate-dependent aminotransferase EpsN